jgi:hypothetical protein
VVIVRSEDGLFVLQSYIDASEMERDAICNGCGSADAKFDFVPDTLWGVSINSACCVHDWAYEMGETWADKTLADFCFLINMLIIIVRASRWLQYARSSRALKYWFAVHRKGADAFWGDKHRPEDRKSGRH